MAPDRAEEIASRIRADYALTRGAAEAIKQAILQACAEQRQEYADLMDEAAVNVSDWGAYASEYFQDKWDLAGYVKKWQDRAAAIREGK
mgnify:FL=1|tara:strand:- start:898 stop:1164 length:267 start_codon:yes stop_codon:yes gene_type:complete